MTIEERLEENKGIVLPNGKTVLAATIASAVIAFGTISVPDRKQEQRAPEHVSALEQDEESAELQMPMFTYCTDDRTLKMYSSSKRDLELLFGTPQLIDILSQHNQDVAHVFMRNYKVPEGIELKVPLTFLPAEHHHFSYLDECQRTVIIDQDTNSFYFYDGLSLALSTRCADSKKGYERLSPGMYQIEQKITMKRSKKFDNAAMPYAQKIHGNYFFHSGEINYSGRISHGCVRIPHIYAQAMFGMTQLGDKVVVLGKNKPNKL